jgi:hypothetical protein
LEWETIFHIPIQEVKLQFCIFQYSIYLDFYTADPYETNLQVKKKKKVKLSRYTPWGERRYSSYSDLTSALDGGEWSASRPGRVLPLGKEPLVPIG